MPSIIVQYEVSNERADSLRILGRHTSSNVQKVMWTIGELGIEYQREDLGGMFGGLDTESFATLNPNRRIPVIDDGGTVVWESNAIVRYLCHQYASDSLSPSDAASQASADQWMDWMSLSLEPDWIYVFHSLYRTPPEKRHTATIDSALKRINVLYTLLDTHLAKHAFVAGDEFSMGDIPIGMTLYRYYELMDITRPTLSALERYYQRLCKRPAYRTHVMMDQRTLHWTQNLVL